MNNILIIEKKQILFVPKSILTIFIRMQVDK